MNSARSGIRSPSVESGPRSARHRRAATVAAVAALLLAPLAAGAIATGSPWALIGLPLESLVAVILIVALPGRRTRTIVAGVFAVVVVAGLLVALLDTAFEATIGRPFDIAEDATAIGSALSVVADAAGAVTAWLAVALLLALLALAGYGLARAALRVGRAADAAGRTGLIVVTAVALTWILAALTGTASAPSVARAGAITIARADAIAVLAATGQRTAQTIADRAEFERELATDDLRDALPPDALAALAGKDVVLAFVESYGRVALEERADMAGIAEVLREGEAQLRAVGFDARSGFLTSPTFGGVSWLAHATLQSGFRVDAQPEYDHLLTTERLTLSRLFSDAGWRTVGVVPSNTEPWPAGQGFYGFDAVFDATSMGYAGPPFGYARVPDQFTWAFLHDRELAAGGPVMAEVDLVSSHTPWTPLPELVPWEEVGDGSAFAGQLDGQPSSLEVWTDADRVRAHYARSIEYALGTVVSYLDTLAEPDLVLVLVGDHQPATVVSGDGAGRDVPVTVIAHDPAVIERIEGWGWDAGLHPSADAPVWRMDEFRDRFVEAFSP